MHAHRHTRIPSKTHVHTPNVLVDSQGKWLPTPETVPFRLTRDIVDGMGVAGTSGVFRCDSDVRWGVERFALTLIAGGW